MQHNDLNFECWGAFVTWRIKQINYQNIAKLLTHSWIRSMKYSFENVIYIYINIVTGINGSESFVCHIWTQVEKNLWMECEILATPGLS